MGGGQIRTIQCDCGWSCRKQLQEANKLYKLHRRVSHKEVVKVAPEFCSAQGLGGITENRQGYTTFTPLTPTGIHVFE